jgi:hypothetical protein
MILLMMLLFGFGSLQALTGAVTIFQLQMRWLSFFLETNQRNLAILSFAFDLDRCIVSVIYILLTHLFSTPFFSLGAKMVGTQRCSCMRVRNNGIVDFNDGVNAMSSVAIVVWKFNQPYLNREDSH